MANPPSVMSVRAETQDEAIAFFAGAIQALPQDDRARLLSSTVIVSDEDAWRQLMFSHEPLYLIARMSNLSEVLAAANRGYHVLLPLARQHPGDASTLDLSTPSRDEMLAVLSDMGLDSPLAQQLVWLATRSLAAFRRELALAPAALQPDWANPDEGRLLILAVLAGRWDESRDGDKLTLAGLAGRDYTELREILTRWVHMGDAPLALVGTTWMVLSRLNAWKLLARFAGREELVRLQEACEEVLGEIDPQFELAPEDRYAASIHGKVPTRSSALREGLAETVALLGAVGGTTDVQSSGDWACWIVRERLGLMTGCYGHPSHSTCLCLLRLALSSS